MNEDDLVQEAIDLFALANQHCELGALDSALRLSRRATLIVEQARGAGHPELGVALHNHASLRMACQASPARTRECLERALETFEQAHGLHVEQVAWVLNDLATLELQAGDLPSARDAAARAVDTAEVVWGLQAPETASSLGLLGTVLFRQRRFTAAIRVLERAIAIREAHDLETEALAVDYEQLGRCLEARGKTGQAREKLARAERIAERLAYDLAS